MLTGSFATVGIVETGLPSRAGSSTADAIEAALRLLDVRLEAAVGSGMPLRAPLGFCAPLLGAETIRGTRFDRLRELFDLSPFDLGVLVMALAPELDLRYASVPGGPTVDLALNLMCANPAEKLRALGRLAPDAPLRRHQLVRLTWIGAERATLAATLRLDEVVLGFLLEHPWLDSRLATCCKIVGSVESVDIVGSGALTTSAAERAQILYVQARDLDETLTAVRKHSATATAMATATSVLVVDVEAAMWEGGDWDVLVAAALRAADLGGHAILMHRADVLLDVEHRARLGQMLRHLERRDRVAYLGGSGAWEASGIDRAATVITLPEIVSSPIVTREVWQRELARQQSAAAPEAVARLAATFVSLTANQIAGAVSHARRTRSDKSATLDAEALMEGARQQARGALRGLAQRVRIAPTLDDVILPAGTLAQLRELPSRVLQRATVLDDWGFAGPRAYGRGTAVLFSGSSGTGKTFAAAALAATLGQDLFRIDLAAVVSKYIGETKKNLARVFDAAERSDCVLLFDEADALFGKRSEVKDAHDRHSNQEVAYLLQRMEQFGGLAILTTNLPESIDEAFLRRLAMTVHFPVPDRAERLRLWQRALPETAPRSTDLDIAELAERFPITGGVITKTALAAAFFAAEQDVPISREHLLFVLEREAAVLGLPGMTTRVRR